MDEFDRRGNAQTLDRTPDASRKAEAAAADLRDQPLDRVLSEARRGRFPSARSARGWKDILLRLHEGISDDRILVNSAGVAFYALLALFPAIAAVVSIYGLFADPASIAKQLDAASGILPGGGIDVIRDQLTRLTAHGSTSLGVGFLVGLAVSLWSANGGVKALFDALNVVYAEKEKRTFIKLNAISLLFTLGFISFLLVALACLIAIPIAFKYRPPVVGIIFDLARWPLLLVLVALALALIYRYGPSRNRPRWGWITWGSAFAAVAWLAASALFSWYAAKFGSFNKTYGSLGAVIGFMIWMWLSIIVILVGAKLNAETEQQTAARKHKGAEKR
jgi:membrane protein